jgi:hypothetical protein
MRPWLWRFVSDERGFVTSPEWAFVTTILVLGAITGAVATRHSSERAPVEKPAAVRGR